MPPVTTQQYLLALETFLKSHYPECILIPTANNYRNNEPTAKNPAYSHKDATTEYLWSKWDTEGKARCAKGLVIVMRKDMIVLDIDDVNLAQQLEEQFPAIKSTAIQQTKNGRHYFFRRTPLCDDFHIVDKARCLQGADGATLPIDIKTVCATGTGGVISIFPSPGKQWLRSLYDHPPIPIPDELLDYIIKHHKDHQPANKPIQNNAPSNTASTVDLEEVKALVNILDPTRASNYPDWIALGWCLHNIDSTNLLQTWVEFSKQDATKFQEGICERLWETMRDEGYYIGTLHMWAKHDAPYEYRLIVQNNVFYDIKECTGKHHSFAQIAYKLLKGRYVCAASSGKLWYKFDGTLWKQDKDCISLRKELTETVKQHFITALNRVLQEDPNHRSVSEAGSTSTMREMRSLSDKIQHNAYKLQDENFKDGVVRALREFFYDETFLDKLDANPNLIAFTNGVWELKEHRFRNARPTDYLSMSVGYPYNPKPDPTAATQVQKYWQSMHPDPEQRDYVIRTFSRQLYGDHGNELFHIHAGFQGSAANGKTKFFEILEHALGNYVCKFGVEMLTAKKRPEPGKPMPEFSIFRGKRIAYCTEPNHDDVLNSGIMKDLTGGEKIMYRLLFSNDINEFRPQYKMHIMCNDTPKVDGSDEGVKRRIRKIDYISRFVDEEEVDESRNQFKRDPNLISAFKDEDTMKMEFLRHLLDTYDHKYKFTMPKVIKENSAMYLEENNAVYCFIREYIQADRDGHFTLKEAKDMVQCSEYASQLQLTKLKADLEKALRTQCQSCKRYGDQVKRYVFVGWSLRDTNDDNEIDMIDG